MVLECVGSIPVHLFHDFGADGKRGGCRGAGGVKDMEAGGAAYEVEVVDQFTFRGEGLGADTGTAWGQVCWLNGRHKALELTAEVAFAEGAAQLAKTHFWIFHHKAPEAAVGEGVAQVAEVDVGFAVAFTGEGEDGIRASFNTSMNKTGEMDAEEGELGVGHGVNEVADEVMAVGFELKIFTTEGDDA